MTESFTLAEKRVLDLAGHSALTRKEMAAQLHLSESCVQFHLTSIYHKLGWRGAGSRVKLCQWCAKEKTGK